MEPVRGQIVMYPSASDWASHTPCVADTWACHRAEAALHSQPIQETLQEVACHEAPAGCRVRPWTGLRPYRGGTGAPVGDSASTGEPVVSTQSLTASTELNWFVPEVEMMEAVEANPTSLRG